MSRAATDTAGWVIRCAGIDGAYGDPAPAGWWLASYDPADGIAEWTSHLGCALRFPTEVAAAGCVEAGLTTRWRTRIEAIPVSRPPVVDGRFTRAITGQDLTEEQRAKAQDAVDRLWLGGYFR